MAVGVPPEGIRVGLRDGTPALIRPIQPGDKWRLREGLQLLSARSRFLRFHTPVQRLSEVQLRYLTEVDHVDHEALVALDPGALDQPGLGVGRYIRLAGAPQVAEAAITVADPFQGRGLGTILLDLLARAAIEHGVRTLRSYVLASNEGMLALFTELGATRSYEGDGAYVVDVPLPGDPDQLADTAAARILRASARQQLPPFAPILASPDEGGPRPAG